VQLLHLCFGTQLPAHQRRLGRAPLQHLSEGQSKGQNNIKKKDNIKKGSIKKHQKEKQQKEHHQKSINRTKKEHIFLSVFLSVFDCLLTEAFFFTPLNQ